MALPLTNLSAFYQSDMGISPIWDYFGMEKWNDGNLLFMNFLTHPKAVQLLANELQISLNGTLNNMKRMPAVSSQQP